MLNEQSLAMANLAIQLTLGATLLVAAYLAKIKRNYARHCLVLRIAVPVEILAVAFVMSASLGRHLQITGLGFLRTEMLIHHSLGVIVILIWIFANLAFQGVIKYRGRLAPFMRVAFVSWGLTLIIGLHIYSVVWL